VNHLLRERAPITEEGWAELDEEARSRLEPGLAARKVVDFSGPLGWDYSATNLGRIEPLQGGSDGLASARRRVLPLVEVRVDFTLSRSELADLERGADDIDLEPLETAARRIARAENRAVFHGWESAGFRGIAESCTHDAVALSGDFNAYTRHVAEAVETLLRNGIKNPYALADHLRKILQDGPIVWAPGVQGAVVVSLRGGDFLFESGQDLSIGYSHHDAETVSLYLEESFSFRVATPEAACALTPPS
jgi:uncharacterized linocin/CFP29 family protein